MMMMLPSSSSSSSSSSSTPSSSTTSSPSSMIASPGGSSVSKRLAKRSILGTRVVAPGDDGKLYPGIIQAMKTCEDRLGQNRYSVKFDDTRRVKEFRETEIVGPGFQNVTSSKLRSGQIVYVTHCNREMQGAVVHHRPNIDQVIIQLLNGGPEVKKKLEEVRLLESRKSARLIGHGANTDFSKLADFNIVHERKRLNSETNSDISGASCRKRRGSETLSDSSGDEFHSGMWSSCSDDRSTTPIMSECTAAMVLMNLSYSPRWLQMAPANPMGNHPESANHENRDSRMTTPCSSPVNMTMAASAASPLTTHFSDLASVAANVMIDGSVSPSSSGISSLGSSWTSTPNLTEAEALLQLSNQESDEGIVSDQSSSADPYDDANKRLKTEHSQIIYTCTWPNCETAMNTQSEIERHIRRHHLKKPDPKSEEERDHEEDFYYEEIQVPCSSQLISKCGSPSAVRPSQFPLVHHGTNPLTSHRIQGQTSSGRAITVLSKVGGRSIHVLADHIDMARPPHENPEYNQLRGGLLAQGTNVTLIQHPSSHHHRHQLLQQQQQPQKPQPYPSVPNVIPGSPLALVSNGVVSTSPATSMRPPVSNSSSSIVSNYNGSKLLRLSPKPTNPVPKSPIRRPRGDTKKCRKVYGMDQKESWCTQCKWKKACSRFSELST